MIELKRTANQCCLMIAWWEDILTLLEMQGRWEWAAAWWAVRYVTVNAECLRFNSNNKQLVGNLSGHCTWILAFDINQLATLTPLTPQLTWIICIHGLIIKEALFGPCSTNTKLKKGLVCYNNDIFYILSTLTLSFKVISLFLKKQKQKQYPQDAAYLALCLQPAFRECCFFVPTTSSEDRQSWGGKQSKIVSISRKWHHEG